MTELVVDKVPSDSDSHTWADFIELLALINLDGICTADAAADRIHDIERGSDENDHHDTHDAEGEEPVANERKRAPARHRARIGDAFALISWRAKSYGAAYPFVLDEDAKAITLANEISPAQDFYLFLLIASNLRFVRGGFDLLTDEFEAVSREVMRDVLPAAAEVHLFGKASSTRYSGSAFEKISALVQDVRGNLITDKDGFRKNDSGDCGIDLVGWHGLSDEQRNIFVYFGQCACSRDNWSKKQLEASPENLANVMSTTPRWSTILFVPVCFRKVGGAWATLSDVASVVFMDRMRLLKNSTWLDKESLTNGFRKLVDEIRSRKEPIV